MQSNTGEAGRTYLEISDLWKAFGDFYALKDISLSVNEGEFICFLGPSGCGKTTLLRAIAGLDLQTRGVVRQGQKDISNLPPAERDFGIVFQSYALFPNLTIERNVAFGLENIGMSKADIEARVSELLELVGLSEQGRKYPAQLSGGQQQRIALARAIATSPGLLLLDEPLSALDAKVRVHLRHEIKELQRQLGITTVMVTHDQEEALSMADRIVVMNHGIIEQVGTPTEIYCNPETLFVANFIGEMNKMPVQTRHDETTVSVGSQSLKCSENTLAASDNLIATIRPEDIAPYRNPEEAKGDNLLTVIVEEMEFLGSFWRTRLHHDGLGDVPLIADFSINAVRRVGIEVQGTLTVSLPSERLQVFSDTTGA